MMQNSTNNLTSKVSIIVPSYNQGKYLQEALDSVLCQTYNNWECIIINDGSIDNTEVIAMKYVELDKRFRYIYQDNQGVIEARNRAIKDCNGTYILPLDGDDKIDKTYLEKAVAIIEENSDIKIVTCEVEMFGTMSGKLLLPEFSMQTLLARNCFVVTSLFRKTDFDAIGGFKTNMLKGLEDWDLWISLLETGGKVVRIPEVLFFYRFKAGESRDQRNCTIDREVKENIVHNHPLLYFNHYKDLYSFTQSKSYKIAKAINNINLRIRSVFK